MKVVRLPLDGEFRIDVDKGVMVKVYRYPKKDGKERIRTMPYKAIASEKDAYAYLSIVTGIDATEIERLTRDE